MPVKDRKIKIRERSKILAGLQEIVADMISELDLQVILQKAVERTAELVGADIVTIHIYDPLTGRVRTATGHGVRDEKTFHQHKPGRSTVALMVANRGEPVIAEDVSVSELAGPFSAREGVQSAAGFPLKVGDKVIGVLFVSYREPHKFEPEEVETLVSFGNLAAVAIGNANLIGQERQRADAIDLLQQVSAKISTSLYVEETLALIIEGAMRLTGTDSGVIHLVDEAKQAVIQSYEVPEGFGHLPPRFSQKKGLTWTTVSTGQTIAVPDITRDERVNPAMAEKGVRAIISTPLKVEGKTIGVLRLNDSISHEFTEYEKELLSTLASQAAIAIQNARLITDLQRQAKGHRTLNRVGTMLTGILDEEVILKSVARAVADTLDCNHCTIFRVEDENLVTRAAEGNRGWSFPLGRTFKLGYQGVPGWVAQTGISALVAHTHNDERFDPGWSAPQPDPQSLVVVPIPLEGEVYGVISAEHDRAAAFDKQDQQLLETLAVQASQAVRNARLLQRERTARQQAETLREISGAIGSAEELKEVAERILDELSKVVEYRRASLQLVREDGDSRILLATRGFDEKAIDRWFLRPISQDRLASRIVASQKPLILSQPSKDPDWGIHPGTADVKSWVGTPLVYSQETIGLLMLDHDQPGFYTQAIKDVLVSFANQVAIDIRNARLFDSAQLRIRDLTIINEVVQVISTELDYEDLLQTIVSQIADKLDCVHCTLFSPQEEQRELLLVPQVTHGVRSKEIMTRRFKLDEGLAGWVFQHGRSLVLANAVDDPRFSPAREERDQPRSMLVAPVKVGDKTIGVISADQDAFGWFNESDRRLVDALAQQAGIAIQRATGLALLQDIGNRIISLQKVDDILQQVVSGAIKLTNVTAGIIYLISEDEMSVTKSFQHPSDFDHQAPGMDREGVLTRKVVATGETLIIPDTRWDDRVSPVLRNRVRSMIAVPLKLMQKVIGVLYLNDKDSHDFTETEVSLLSTLASQAAIAIENARLYEHIGQNLERRIRELEVLTEIGRTVSNLGIDQILDLVYEQTARVMDLSNAYFQIAFYDEAKDEVSFPLAVEQDLGEVIDIIRWGRREAQYRMSDESEIVEQLEPRARRDPPSLTEYVIRNRQPVLIVENFEQQVRRLGIQVWPLFGRLRRPMHSWLGVPMMVAGRVIGVISIQSMEQEHAFDEEQQELLATVANQAAVAIENARLYTQLTLKITELEQAQIRIAAAESMLVRSMIAADFIHRINNLAGTIPIWIELLRGEVLQETPRRMEAVAEYLDKIEQDTRGLLGAAEQLREAPQERNVDIGFMLQSILRQVRIQYHKTIEIVERIQPELHWVRAMSFSLTSALGSIISNGIEAMLPKGGGTLTVKASDYLDSQGVNWVKIEVQDTGIGIAEQDMHRVFMPFFSTKGAGRGYGLWRAKTVVEDLRGSISVESQVGGGTVFKVMLPTAISQEE